MERSRDEVVVVTGASRGIGLETALAFAREGARLVLAARDADALSAAVTAALAAGAAGAIAVTCDVTDERGPERLVDEAVRAFGRIDVLINNAGVGLYKKVGATTAEELRRLLEVNVLGAHRVIRAALPTMRAQRRGVIVNVSSVVGKRALPLLGAYSASKAALGALTDALRLEERQSGLDVLLVCPGRTDTAFSEHALAASGAGASRPHRREVRAMAPEVVGRAIVAAVLARRRELLLTGMGRALAWAERASPRLVDAALGRLVAIPREG